MPHIGKTLAVSPNADPKRKRITDHVEEQTRNSKRIATDSSKSIKDIPSEILVLETEILESRKNYNNITILLEYAKTECGSDGRDVAAVVALYRVFCKFMVLGNLTKNVEASDAESTIVRWLNERLKDFEESLLQILRSADPAKQLTALTLLMRLVKEKATHLVFSKDTTWRNGLFHSIVQGLVTITDGEPAVDVFVNKYVKEFDDVRYYTFTHLADIVLGTNLRLANVLYILASIEPLPEPEPKARHFYLDPPSKKKHNLYSLVAHKTQGQKAWMTVLRKDLDKAQRKRILDLMSHRVAPWFVKLEMLMDFLTDSFNVGGSTSLMALSGLFYLIQQKNLDYPQFYVKLYSLLDDNVLHSKHRSRFFRLLDTFLASTHLPAALVASFVKRLSRLCLHAPPSGIVVVVPWIYNVLRNHPTCTFMIHQTTTLQSRNSNGWGDPFLMDEPDPMGTNAIESSLWEIHTLQSHYHPNVAAVAKIISEQFTKQAYNVEDFLDHSYATMLDAELCKDVKRPPEVEYEIPKKIFTKHDAEARKEDGLLVELWQFS